MTGHRWYALATRVVRAGDAWSWSVKVRGDDGVRKWGGTRATREAALDAVADRLAKLAGER